MAIKCSLAELSAWKDDLAALREEKRLFFTEFWRFRLLNDRQSYALHLSTAQVRHFVSAFQLVQQSDTFWEGSYSLSVAYEGRFDLFVKLE